MKILKYIVTILSSAFFIVSCSSVKETLTGSKKIKTDEFLIEKKNPLVLPPNFSELPKPQTEIAKSTVENVSIDLSSVLKKSKSEKKIIKNRNNSIEKSISKILNSK